jgi:tRNA pseudouridine55 synthase
MTGNERTGVLPVDKPVGPTSHDVVARARRALGQRRIGHTGTLDPFASGLLLLCVGVATRIAEYLTEQPKKYQAVMTFGAYKDTDDATGATIATSDEWRDLSRQAVTAALAEQEGRRLQRPPAFSAKKVRGERMYKLAREGRAPALEPVPVEIYRVSMTGCELPTVAFDVDCSAGTYIRAIARDVGDSLGVPAYLSSLRRTTIGSMGVERAVALDELGDMDVVGRAWITPVEALSHMPSLSIDRNAATDLAHGRAVPAREVPPGLATAILDDRLVAIVESDGHTARPRKVFV